MKKNNYSEELIVIISFLSLFALKIAVWATGGYMKIDECENEELNEKLYKGMNW